MTYPPYPPGPAQPGPPPPGRGWQVVVGIVIGVIASVVLPLASLGIADSTGLGALLVSLVIVPGVGVVLMCVETTRRWGLGLLIGWAIAVVVAGGACVAILSSLS